MKLAIYSVTYAGIWYDDTPLSVEELICRAAEYGYDGVEIDGKRPHGFPLDWNSSRRKEIRRFAEDKGIELVGVAANNNFASPIPERRESEVLAVSNIIRLASDLGAKIVRVFAAWQGITVENGKGSYEIARDDRFQYPTTWLDQWNWCRDSLGEVARVAEACDVILALQNHKPVIRGHRDMLDMVREVSSEYLRCSLDAPLLDFQDETYVTAAVYDTGQLQVLSHFGGEFEKDRFGGIHQKDLNAGGRLVNYPAFVKALENIGYKGYLSYELCHPFLVDGHRLGSLQEVDEQVQLARAYMKRIIEEAGR